MVNSISGLFGISEDRYKELADGFTAMVDTLTDTGELITEIDGQEHINSATLVTHALELAKTDNEEKVMIFISGSSLLHVINIIQLKGFRSSLFQNVKTQGDA